MHEKPFISIITASFNNDSTIRKTIESVKNQSFKSIEHIIVDNCSTDKTLDIIREHAGAYNLKWISEPDKGIADALNKGLQKSNGTYVLIIQADDMLISSDILQDIIPDFQNEECDMVCYPIILNHRTQGRKLCPNKPLWLLRFKTAIRHQGALVHKRLYEKVGNYNITFSIAMDYDFFYRAIKANAMTEFYQRPIAEMGGEGICESVESLPIKIDENYKVQKLNENNYIWRVLQLTYYIYKKHLRHYIRPSFWKNSRQIT